VVTQNNICIELHKIL